LNALFPNFLDHPLLREEHAQQAQDQNWNSCDNAENSQEINVDTTFVRVFSIKLEKTAAFQAELFVLAESAAEAAAAALLHVCVEVAEEVAGEALVDSVVAV
jgi:hypothetical protein